MADDAVPGDPDRTSPWASEVPIPAAPIEFTWTPDAGDDPGHPVGATGQPPATPAGPGAGSNTPADRPGWYATPSGGGPSWSGATTEAAVHQAPLSRLVAFLPTRRGVGVVALAVVVLAASVWVVSLGRDDAPAAEEPPATSVEPVSDSTAPPTTNMPPVSIDRPTTTVAPDDRAAGGGAGDQQEKWYEETIEVPTALSAMTEPMTIVTLGIDGILRETDLPSGEVRAIALGQSAIESVPVVGSRSTLLAHWGGRTSRLVRAPLAPIEVDMGLAPQRMLARPHHDEFWGFAFGLEGLDYDELRVFGDGTTVATPGDTEVGPWARQFSPDGAMLVSDAGGVYRVADDGSSQRISSGTLVASSTHHLLLRECDEARRCGYVTIDVETGTRTNVDVGEDLDPTVAGLSIQVSPDGASLRYLQYGATGATERVVDMTTGQAIAASGSGGFDDQIPVWAADSSGIFRLGRVDGLEFVERGTGASVTFAQEFGSLRSFGIRHDTGALVPAEPLPDTTSGLRVVGLGADGNIHQIDIDSGAVILTEAPAVLSGAPAYVIADADGATVISFDNVESLRFDRATGTTVRTGSTSPRGLLLPGPLVGTVWQSGDRDDGSAGLVFELLAADGSPLGPVVEHDESPIGSDGRGGILVTGSLGGVFVLTADGASRVTTGELIAIGSAAAYVRECSETLQCGVFRVDRATGERRSIDISAFDVAGANGRAGGPFGQNVSPDGEVAVVRTRGSGTAWTMVDSVGAAVSVPQVDALSPVVWSDDSQYALYLSDDVLRLYDRAASRVHTLTTLPALEAFAATVDR